MFTDSSTLFEDCTENTNDHPLMALTLAPECKHLRGRQKDTWRTIAEKEREEFGCKADAMLGFLKRTKKHGKIERSHLWKRT